MRPASSPLCCACNRGTTTAIGSILGILRKPQDDSDVAEGHETWVPLIKNVTSLEITYFDPNATNYLVAAVARRKPHALAREG